MRLRDYQARVLDELWAWFEAHASGDPIVDASVGAGKSILIAAACQRACAEFPGTRIVMLVPQKELLEQNLEKLVTVWPGVDVGVYSASVGRKQLGRQITYATIDSIFRHGLNMGRIDLIFADEAHLIQTKDTGKWRTFIADVRKHSPHARVIGWTGTPMRGNGVWLTAGESPLFTHIASRVGMRELLDLGYLAPLVPAPTAMRLSSDGVRTSGDDYVVSELAKAVDKAELVDAVCDEIVQIGAGRRAWLVYCVTVEHAVHVSQGLQARGIACDVVTGQTPKDTRRRALADLRAGRLRALVNVAVLTTGFDAPMVDAIFLLRATKSPVLYCLDAETQILTSRGWRGIGEIKVGDCALAAEPSTGRGSWSRVVGTVRRPMDPSEKWVEYDAPRANFRVTDKHRMLFQTPTSTGWSPMRIGEAGGMAEYKDSIRMPTAVRVDACGVPLSDDELYIIGILMTDGCWTTHQAVISQSERHPQILERIESALSGAGIAFKKKRIAPPKIDAPIQQRHDRWVYTMSMGDPRCGRPGRGIRYLVPYLDNDLSPVLMQMTRSQLITLLRAIHDGDGFKQTNVTEWTPRGLTFCSVRLAFLDRMQALATMHGMTANLRWECGPSRKKPMGIISINDQDWRSVGGTGKRPQIRVEPATQEEVWCIETEDGTIVTRRKGKVTVMGNCQIAGRGMRVLGANIDESIRNGKRDCAWADFTATTATLGPVDEIKGRLPVQAGASIAPFKLCPSCGSQNPTGRLTCSSCGHEFPPPERIVHGAEASNAAVLSGQTGKLKTVEIDGVSYHRHLKPDAPDSVRVEYRDGLRVVAREWVAFSSGNQFARRKAEDWWTRRAVIDPIPSSTDDALEWLAYDKSILRAPSALVLSKDGKYDSIVEYKFDDANHYESPATSIDAGLAQAAGGPIEQRVAWVPVVPVHEQKPVVFDA